VTDRYSLGLTERDRVNHAFGGGLPTGSVVYLEGPDGAGKSAFTQRFAYGFASEGTTTSYVSTELSASTFVDQMHSLSYDVVDHLLFDRLLFLHADVDTGGEASPRRLLDRLMEPGPLWSADVVVVDGLDALLRNDPRYEAASERGDEDDVVQSFVSYLRSVTATGRTVVVTVNPDPLTERATRPLRDAARVFLQLETNTVGQEIRRKAVVRRFGEMGAPVDDAIGYSVQQGRGITIESRTIA
jgi:flagellar protein FlaH